MKRASFSTFSRKATFMSNFMCFSQCCYGLCKNRILCLLNFTLKLVGAASATTHKKRRPRSRKVWDFCIVFNSTAWLVTEGCNKKHQSMNISASLGSFLAFALKFIRHFYRFFAVSAVFQLF